MSSDSVHSFICMGTRMALWIEPGESERRAGLIDEAVVLLRDFEQRFTRFDASSELSRLNASPATTVPVSTDCSAYLSAAIWAAEFSDGMVDPTLLQAMQRNGYDRSRGSDNPIEFVAVRQASDLAPLRHPSSANPAALWRQVKLDHAARTVTRPVGVQFDAGGTGKGYAADMVAALFEERLPAGTRWFVDCGGDLRLSEVPVGQQPHGVDVQHPLTGQLSHRFQVWGGAVATSGISRRAWRNADGSYAHHLLDPSTGKSAWSGLISVTAVGASALQAEVIAKWALLSGPAKARELLALRGGLMVHDSGAEELVEPHGRRHVSAQNTSRRSCR